MLAESKTTVPSPERLTPSEQSIALKTRLALGNDALEVSNTQVSKVGSSHELHTSFEQNHANTESRIARASIAKRKEYWDSQEIREESEQLKKWKEDVVGLCQTETNQEKINILTSRRIGEIDWKNITDEQVGNLYNTYFGALEQNIVSFHNKKGEIVRIPSGTTHFVEEIVRAYTKEDGTIDYNSLHQDRAALEFAAGIFGIDKLLFEYIDVVTTLKDEQRTQALINAANQEITAKQLTSNELATSKPETNKPTTRLNDLNTYEEEQLKLLSEGYETKAEDVQLPPTKPPANQSSLKHPDTEEPLKVQLPPTTEPLKPEEPIIVKPTSVEKHPVLIVPEPKTKPADIKPSLSLHPQTQPLPPNWPQELQARIDTQRKAEIKVVTLTPELAQKNPELYKIQMLEALRQKNPIIYMAWEKLEKEGELSLTDLTLRPNTWTGASHKDKRIELGTQPIPPAMKKAVIFEHSAMTYTDEVLHRLSHEICHKLQVRISELAHHTSQIDEIHRTCKDMRDDHNDSGLSALASLPYYRMKGTQMQAIEDSAELVNMYVQDPRYLRRFLNYLSNPHTAKERKQLGLVDIEPHIAEIIYQGIEYEVAAYLTGKKAPEIKPEIPQKTPLERVNESVGQTWGGQIPFVRERFNRSEVAARKLPVYYPGAYMDLDHVLAVAETETIICDDFMYIDQYGNIDPKTLPEQRIEALQGHIIGTPRVEGTLGKGGKRIVDFEWNGKRRTLIEYAEDAAKFTPPELKQGAAMVLNARIFGSAPRDGIGGIQQPESFFNPLGRSKLVEHVAVGGFLFGDTRPLLYLPSESIGLKKISGEETGFACFQKEKIEPLTLQLIQLDQRISDAKSAARGGALIRIEPDTLNTDYSEAVVAVKKAYDQLPATIQTQILPSIREHLTTKLATNDQERNRFVQSGIAQGLNDPAKLDQYFTQAKEVAENAFPEIKTQPIKFGTPSQEVDKRIKLDEPEAEQPLQIDPSLLNVPDEIVSYPIMEIPKNVNLIGEAGDKLKIVITDPAIIEKANQDLLRRSWTNGQFHEEGGEFIGQLYRTSSGEVWTEVIDYVPYPNTPVSSWGQLVINHEMGHEANMVLNKMNLEKGTNYQFVGWAHSHPPGWEGKMTGGARDDFINKNYFGLPGNFAYVFGAGLGVNTSVDVHNLSDLRCSFFSQGGADQNFGYFSRHKGVYTKTK